MKIFIESVDKEVWHVVVNGYFIPFYMVECMQVQKELSTWSIKENKRV